MPSPQDIKQWITDAIKWHRHDGVLTQRVNALDLFDDRRFFLYRVLADTTPVATGTDIGGGIVMPFSGKIVEVGATVDSAGTTGTMQLDVNNNGSSILGTNITLDSGETDSRTAATPNMIDPQLASFKKGDVVSFDVDTVQTTPATGLTFFVTAVATSY